MKELLNSPNKTQYKNISEFQRQVHAEMAALVDSARRGVAVDGLTMYVTTFPCHNCAKHIIAAGLNQVVYLEPYAKSRVRELHPEEVDLDARDGKSSNDDRVKFVAYTGVAPRQYSRLFSMTSRGAKNGLALKAWNDKHAILTPPYMLKNAALSYTENERAALEGLNVSDFHWDRAAICP